MPPFLPLPLLDPPVNKKNFSLSFFAKKAAFPKFLKGEVWLALTLGNLISDLKKLFVP